MNILKQKPQLKDKLLVITGPTASGKTRLASLIAYELNGEIISADSRQVYKDMNLGTGKDYDDYIINEKNISYHLIDIIEAGKEYNVFRFQKDFIAAFKNITTRNKLPILCGGTGMYIESIVKKYNLIDVPINKEFRRSIVSKSDEDLKQMLIAIKNVHNTTDLINRERIIRAIEIELHSSKQVILTQFPKFDFKIFALRFDREILKNRITQRLKNRLDNGMIDEVKTLISKGIDIDKLKFYGLEYKYLAMYLNNEINYNEMFKLLNIAIHQFAKRQMTWLRKMERSGIEIFWIDGKLPEKEKMNLIIHIF